MKIFFIIFISLVLISFIIVMLTEIMICLEIFLYDKDNKNEELEIRVSD